MIGDPRCAICDGRIQYLDPTAGVIGAEDTNGWWAHEFHPEDEHEAMPSESWVRADERERIAQAIEAAAPADIYLGREARAMHMAWDEAVRIAREGGTDALRAGSA